jgi:hypothetical protein
MSRHFSKCLRTVKGNTAPSTTDVDDLLCGSIPEQRQEGSESTNRTQGIHIDGIQDKLVRIVIRDFACGVELLEVAFV